MFVPAPTVAAARQNAAPRFAFARVRNFREHAAIKLPADEVEGIREPSVHRAERGVKRIV
jgi:hypothetical protein